MKKATSPILFKLVRDKIYDRLIDEGWTVHLYCDHLLRFAKNRLAEYTRNPRYDEIIETARHSKLELSGGFGDLRFIALATPPEEK